MSPIRRCHVCGTHFRPSPDRRHGRIDCRNTTGPDVTLPTTAFVCADCRPEVVDLTRHWEPRDPSADACSFCAEPTDGTGRIDLASIVDDRVVSQGTYLLCRHCEDVFETFLADLHTGLEFPDAWSHTPAPGGAVFDREGDLRVTTTAPTAPESRLRLLDDGDPIVEAITEGAPRERAREFVTAFEAFDAEGGADPRRIGNAVVEGNPHLRSAQD
ncbi:hypothetical protein [Haloplanus halobius]|uniref:hypothetical protein n=1 Tax=Haloplanus halobius TaxID=2934938 RepID=UPI00200F478F|nr:hypothetical protein [Haloplanus sp. XH21]